MLYEREVNLLMNSWIVLFVAGMFEVAWSVGLKYSHGFSRLWPSVFTVATMTLSFVCLPSR